MRSDTDYEISVYQCGGGHRQHGRIAAEKCRELQAQGHECAGLRPRRKRLRGHPHPPHRHDRDIKLHGLMTRHWT